MGTVYDQQPRNNYDITQWCLDQRIEMIKTKASENDLTYDQVLRTMELLEQTRRNDLYVANGDNFDEQMCGIAKCIDNLTEAIRENNLYNHPDHG